MRRLVACVLLLSVACESQAATLRLRGLDALLSRDRRSLPYGGGGAPADPGAANVMDPLGPVDAVVDQQAVTGKKGDSSEELNAQIAYIEKQIAELTKPLSIAERVAAKKEQLAAKEAPQQQAAPDPAPAPDPAQPGPDNSNKEDGDGNGNNTQQQDAPSPAAGPPAPLEAPQGGGPPDVGNEDTRS